MLPKTYRLKNNSAFIATYKTKNIISNDMFLVYVGKEKAEETQQTKIGFVVSKKYHKRAVKRNRIKRLMREIIRLKIKNCETEKIEKYLSLIFIPKQNTINADFKTIKNSLNLLIKRIK